MVGELVEWHGMQKGARRRGWRGEFGSVLDELLNGHAKSGVLYSRQRIQAGQGGLRQNRAWKNFAGEGHRWASCALKRWRKMVSS